MSIPIAKLAIDRILVLEILPDQACNRLPVALRQIGTTGNLSLHRPPNQWLIPAIPFREEGRSRVVTNAGWDVVDAKASARMAVAGRVEPRERLQARKTNDVLAYGKTVWS